MIYENHMWYFYFNFTTKQQTDDGTGSKLFFVEVSLMQRQNTFKVRCCCEIGAEDNDGILIFIYKTHHNSYNFISNIRAWRNIFLYHVVLFLPAYALYVSWSHGLATKII